VIPLDKAGQARVYRMARRLAFTRCLHECPEEIAKDLEQAAYLKLQKLTKREHLWKDLEYAMLEEISRWCYSCKSGRGSTRVMRYKHSLYDVFMVFGKPKPLEEVLV